MPALSEALAWSVALGLAERTATGRVRLTAGGRRFLSSNPFCAYELTPAQKHLLAARIVTPPGVHGCRDLLAKCVPCFERGRFELPPSAIAHSDLQRISLLTAVGVLAVDDDGTYVAEAYSRDVRGQVSRRRMSALELKVRLRDQDEVGTEAELYVLRQEQARLEKAGLNLEASLVRRISHLDVAAGYDIDSFDDRWRGDYDRRVEVKATVKEGIRFYWTRNEMSVALREGRRYWLYIVTCWDRRRRCGSVHRLREPAAFFKARKGLCSIEAVVSEIVLPAPGRLDWNPDTGAWK